MSVERSESDGKWYVVGHVGVRGPFETEQDARAADPTPIPAVCWCGRSDGTPHRDGVRGHVR